MGIFNKTSKIDDLEKKFAEEVQKAARIFNTRGDNAEELYAKRASVIGAILEAEDEGSEEDVERLRGELRELEQSIETFGVWRDQIHARIAKIAFEIYEARKETAAKDLEAVRKEEEALVQAATGGLAVFLQVAERFRFDLGNRVTRLIKESTADQRAMTICAGANNIVSEKREENQHRYEAMRELVFFKNSGKGEGLSWAKRKTMRAIGKARRDLKSGEVTL